MNPYWNLNFFQFMGLFFERLFLKITRQLPWSSMASDEIQVFVLVLIALSAALIGTLLVLRRMTMVANSLSHTILIGIVGAYLLAFSHSSGEFNLTISLLSFAAFLTAIVTTLLTEFLHQVVKLQEDASIGLVFTSLFALGIIFVTFYTRNAHIGLEIVMGNADALHLNDLKGAAFVAAINAVLVFVFFKEWKLTSFDPILARSLGFFPSVFAYLLMLMTSATAISAFRAVGVILFLAFLVGLPLIGKLFSRSLKGMFIWSASLAVLCALSGVALCRHFLSVYQMPLSTAGVTVVLIGIGFLFALFVKKIIIKVSEQKNLEQSIKP